MNGWFKFYRKTIDNQIWRQDRTAWHLFETILMIADSQGKWSGGINQLASLAGDNKSTTYRALLRLEKVGMINRWVNARYTMIYICKWEQYQYNKPELVNADATPGNTINKNKNKKEPFKHYLKENKKISLKPNLQTRQVIDLFTELRGGSYNNKINIEAINRLLGRYGVDEVLKRAEFGLTLPRKKYTIKVDMPVDLDDHWFRIGELMEEGIKETIY